MNSLIIGSDRMFQVWKYTVGHRQLLLRSTKSPDYPTRIDVFFKGVAEFHLPTQLQGLFVTETSPNDVHRCSIDQAHPFASNMKAYAVKGANVMGYVVARAVFTHEDDLEYDDPSFFSKNNII